MAKDRSKQVLERIDNYVQTIAAVWALVSVVTWDPVKRSVLKGSKYSVGRRMTVGSAGKDVTPDLVVQVASDYGLVAEAKRTLPANEDLWEPVVDQLRRYEGDLEGWWDSAHKLVRDHDVTLLIHQTFGPKLFRHVRERGEKAGGSLFRRDLPIIEFNVFDQVGQRMHLCLRHGQLSIRELSLRLADGIPVPMERVIATYGQKRFYDVEPEPEYLMLTIWTEIVGPGRVGKVRNDTAGGVEVPVSVEAVTRELQEAFGAVGRADRDVEYPKQVWVRRALNGLTDLKLARKVDEDNYVVIYREIRGDLIVRFSNKVEKRPGAGRSGRGSKGGGRRRDTRTLEMFGDSTAE